MTGAETDGKDGVGIFPGWRNPTRRDDVARNEDAFARARRGRRTFDSYSSKYWASWNDKAYEHTRRISFRPRGGIPPRERPLTHHRKNAVKG